MKLQLIRNATIRLNYGGITILIDPMLGAKHSFGSFAGIEDNPTVELLGSAEEVMDGVDLMLISHLHEDHFDKAAQRLDDKALPILCQPGDLEKIASCGFNNVLELDTKTQWQQVSITRTGGQHGVGKWAERLNPVSGFVLKCPSEPTVYWVGDSVWCEEVEAVLDQFQPKVIITHSGGAELKNSGPIIMNAVQTIKVCKALPAAVVIATHLESLDHCYTTREHLHLAAKEAGISTGALLIPADGELININ